MKRVITILLSALVIIVISQGCNEDENDNKTLLPVITGKAGEVVIVVNKDKYPATTKELKDIFTQSYPMLPQEEPVFTAIPIPHSAFSSIFKTHRNLLFVNIKKDLPQDSTGIYVKKNIWAAPQLIIQAYASSDSSMASLLKEKQDFIINLINDWEIRRIKDTYKKIQSKEVLARIERKFHIYLTVPKGYNINIDTTDFLWISRETVEMSQGLFIYTYPYTDTSDLSVDSLISKRDDFLKRFIKGPTFGSWMTTEKRIEPEVTKYVKNGNYFVKMRGLWKVENDYMGGPFVSLSTLNADRSKIITVEGYVYAPKYKKREYVRQLEAILGTLQVLKTKKDRNKKK
jgi:hypothetical protein